MRKKTIIGNLAVGLSLILLPSTAYAENTQFYTNQNQQSQELEEMLGQTHSSHSVQQKQAAQQKQTTQQNVCEDLKGVMESFLKPRGDRIATHNRSILRIDGKDIGMTIISEYMHGPGGGSGALNLRAHLDLDQKVLCSSIGFDYLTYSFYSFEPIKMSLRTFEVNMNKANGFVTYMPTKYVMFESDYLLDKSERGIYAALKILGLNKKQVDKIFSVKNIIKDLKDYQELQKTVAEGNKVLRGRVYVTKVDYVGYGRIDPNDDKSWLRAPKGVEHEIMRGEYGLKGIKVGVKTRYYGGSIPFLRKTLGSKRRDGGEIEIVFPFDMSFFAESIGVRPETMLEKSEE